VQTIPALQVSLVANRSSEELRAHRIEQRAAAQCARGSAVARQM